MRYLDGEEIHVGDRVKCWEGCYGVVVCSVDTQEYSEEYLQGIWSFLEKGILVLSDQVGLIHYTELDEDFKFIESA